MIDTKELRYKVQIEGEELTRRQTLMLLDELDRYRKFEDLIGGTGPGYPSNVLPMLKERAKLIGLLKQSRKLMGSVEQHGEDCAWAYEEDDSEECDCGAEDYYLALNACADIQIEDGT